MCILPFSFKKREKENGAYIIEQKIPFRIVAVSTIWLLNLQLEKS